MSPELFNYYKDYSEEVFKRCVNTFYNLKANGIEDENNINLNRTKIAYICYVELNNFTNASQDDKIDKIVKNLKKVDYE